MHEIANAIWALVKEIRALRYSVAKLAGKAVLDRMNEVHKEEGEDSMNWSDINDFAGMEMEEAEDATGYYKE